MLQYVFTKVGGQLISRSILFVYDIYIVRVHLLVS